MRRLTERCEYMGKKYISVDSEENEISCSNFCTNCGKADCENIRKVLFQAISNAVVMSKIIHMNLKYWVQMPVFF